MDYEITHPAFACAGAPSGTPWIKENPGDSGRLLKRRSIQSLPSQQQDEEITGMSCSQQEWCEHFWFEQDGLTFQAGDDSLSWLEDNSTWTGSEELSWARSVAFGKSHARKLEISRRKERVFDVGGTAKV